MIDGRRDKKGMKKRAKEEEGETRKGDNSGDEEATA